MINFDEEIQKFKPAQEVDETEDQLRENRVPDLTDILDRIIAKTVEKN